MSSGEPPELTDDAFLGGRVRALQPRRGHRSGLEAVLIAAACPACEGETVLDLGAGAGVASLCLLARVPGAKAILVEADPAMAELAEENLRRNGFGDRAAVRCLRIGEAGAEASNAVAEHAIANPPFRDPRRHRSSPEREAAHLLPVEALGAWIRFSAGAVRGRGTLTLVHEAEALEGVLHAFGHRFGDLHLLPLHPRPGRSARRIIVQGRRGARAPLSLLPGLALHGRDGDGFSDELDRVLRDGARLALGRKARDRERVVGASCGRPE
ncbi:tRNA1(Val) (adenine(37)-N6)-methyltransferase [Lutibaculum baratangense]|uniref:Putative O-methyltransferase n=1 Tax=Lutibaculum baratangense AMV1 TaxID=631454 RepID=V4RNJ8_9HYPH|nr:methyltransferase [Lutibaculum baratangense]ESR24780.1 putative O-methyltransferase [Lutibaculum baratangense AMV1]